MKTFITSSLLTLILLAALPAAGQSSKIYPVKFLLFNRTDSLLKALKTAKHDTTKVNLLNALCWQLKSSYPDSAKAYCLKALKLSKKVDRKSVV